MKSMGSIKTMRGTIIALCIIFSGFAHAQRINPDLDLTEFWNYSEDQQNKSIDYTINEFYYLIRNNGGSFTQAYYGATDVGRITEMKACMKTYGISSRSIGEAYTLCMRKLRWIVGVS